MDSAWPLVFAAAVPFLCLGLMLWLAHLEETLGEGLSTSAGVVPGQETNAKSVTRAQPVTASDALAA